MKTLLICGVGEPLSEQLAYQLALDGHRLLVTGPDFDKLQTLDVALCQSELHRFTTSTGAREVSEWVADQHVGLDGIAIFPAEPDPNPSLLVPHTANLRQLDRSVFSPIELLRELLPQLRRGKRPKRVLVVLPWNTPALLSSAAVELAANLWRTALPRLSAELNRDGIQLNVLFTTPATLDAVASIVEPPFDAAPQASGPSVSHLARADAEETGGAPRAITPCETATFAAGWFGAAFAPLANQFIEHPRRVTASPG